MLLAACGSDDNTPASTATLEDSGSIKDPPAGTPEDPRPTATASSGAVANNEPFVFQSTADGMTMQGHLYSTVGPKRKVVILAHGLNEDQGAWKGFAQELAVQGIAAITFDFRGYGETGGMKDPTKLADDLEVAVRFLKSQDWPLIYIVGSDIGGTAALKVAANQELAGVATVSSVVSTSGLDATAAISQIVEPKLFLAGANDTPAGTAILTMNAAATEPKMSRSIEGTTAHGVSLLGVGETKEIILNFIGAP